MVASSRRSRTRSGGVAGCATMSSENSASVVLAGMLATHERGGGGGLRGGDVRGTGFGAACHGGEPAFHVTLHDWREVDRTVQKLAAWVVREGLRGEIVVFVLPDPLRSHTRHGRG